MNSSAFAVGLLCQSLCTESASGLRDRHHQHREGTPENHLLHLPDLQPRKMRPRAFSQDGPGDGTSHVTSISRPRGPWSLPPQPPPTPFLPACSFSVSFLCSSGSHHISGLPWWLSGKASTCNAGDLGDMVQYLGWEDSLQEEMVTCSSYSCLRNPMDRGAWRTTVHGVTKSPTGLKTHTHIFSLPLMSLLLPPTLTSGSFPSSFIA